jgi:hypothetical protein
MNEAYLQAIQKAQSELEVIENRRTILLVAIEHLRRLCDEEFPELIPPPGYVPEGLTPEIRKILTTAAAHMSPVQIREALIARNFPNSSSKNLLINVHTALGRIKDELDVIERDGKPAYKISSPMGIGNLGEFLAKELKDYRSASEAFAESMRTTVEAVKFPHVTLGETIERMTKNISTPTLAEKVQAFEGRKGRMTPPPKAK